MRCRSLPQRSAAPNALVGPATADFPFVDLASGERWTLRINDGLPWWIFDTNRRVPGTAAFDYLKLARLLRVADDAAVGDVLDCSGALYDRLLASGAARGAEYRPAAKARRRLLQR